jgi:hypothetical protein
MEIDAAIGYEMNAFGTEQYSLVWVDWNSFYMKKGYVCSIFTFG